MNNKILEVRNITRTFDNIKCLDNISFNLYSGDFLLIAGANGSGKTLLMKHLNGLFPIKRSTIFFKGEDCYKKDDLMKKRVGIIFQNPDSQIVGLTVKDDVAFGPGNIGIKGDELNKTVARVLSEMEISHLSDKNPYILSGGEKKRVTIAGVLAMNPDILIFDEPFIGLDYPGVISVTKSLLKLKAEGRNIIVITHDLEKIAAYCNRMIIMSKGKIVHDGLPNELIDKVSDYSIRRPFQKDLKDMTWLT